MVRRRPLRAVFTLLKPLYVDDARMKQDFALMSVDMGGRWGKLTRYILARLEGDASGRDCDYDTDPFTVEHILPQNPADAWEESIPSGLREESHLQARQSHPARISHQPPTRQRCLCR